MPMMMFVSLCVNIGVLAPVLWGLIGNSAGSADAFGPDTSARRILISVYLAIAVLSAVLLVWPQGRAALGPGLLLVQVTYKLLTVPVLGPAHPVAIANLAIALLHGITLVSFVR